MNSAPGDVDVWRLCVADWRSRIPELESGLEDAERERAARFRNPADRLRFVVAHGVARRTLSRVYLPGIAPARLVIRAAPGGKPRLVLPPPLRGPEFNLSHSGDLALLAVAADPVGVDIERIRPACAVRDLAACAFSQRERRALAAAPPPARRELFFHGWVRKEAWIKARGDGLAFPLRGFSVSFAPDDARLLEAPGGPEETRRWTLAPVAAGDGYCAAVAVAATACRCRLRDARPDRDGGLAPCT